MAGGEIGAKLDDDVAAAVESEDQGILLVGHVGSPCWPPLRPRVSTGQAPAPRKRQGKART
jgi:hypothetical protein